MHLVIFDIDGTLTATFRADERCFVRALDEICGFTNVETDWSRYQHATDSGIFHELFVTRLGRPPSPDEIRKFRNRFIDLLTLASSESAFLPIAGAPQLLSRLQRSAEYRVSIATGAWRDCARLKMASAGLCYDDYPTSSGDDAIDRQAIIKLSMKRAAEHYGQFESAIYVGDGIWDARASCDLGIPFVGVGRGTRATRLFAEGAIQVFPDLSDSDAFLRTISKQCTRRSRTVVVSGRPEIDSTRGPGTFNLSKLLTHTMKTKTIEHKVLVHTTPKKVYDALVNSKQHSKFTGAPAKIGSKPGSAFTCYDKYINGFTLELRPAKRIVQAWRSKGWPDGHFSIITFALSPRGKGTTELHFTQIGVPADDYAAKNKGWCTHYWEPLKKFLES